MSSPSHRNRNRVKDIQALPDKHVPGELIRDRQQIEEALPLLDVD
jgi:hypothetical protein